MLVENSKSIIGSIVGAKEANSAEVMAVYLNDKLQGAIAYEINKDNIRVSYLAVAPWNIIGVRRRNRGCGVHLLRHVFKKAVKNIKINYIDLIAFDEAMGFYEKLGFVEDGSVMKITRRKIHEQLGK
jgi:GNAT superfamily N-acetyltransferase